ncbi:MAG: uroporphyrinogen-III synthase [Deltaproteobacteria bacterium]|nr:uroporphyrinogen-III synthase [Deltaproteobacteria bacterium]MDZ4341532.1 uroporphyrinogen-III synthase [Candidatus Binatia bacterium]
MAAKDIAGARGAYRPLAGRRIVVTRARAQAGGLAGKIEELGGEVIEFPTIEIQPPASFAALDAAIARIADYDWLIFTSVNGVEQFLARLECSGKSLADFQSKRVAAIGPPTAERLKGAGISSCLVPEQYQAEGVLDALKPEELRAKRVLIPRAAKAREILPETLRQWGAAVDVVEAYRTVIPTADVPKLRSLLQEGSVDMVTFTSSSTAANFVKLFGGEKLSDILRGTAIGCIGPLTEATVRELGGKADLVSAEFTIPGLVRAMVDFFQHGADTGARPAGA